MKFRQEYSSEENYHDTPFYEQTKYQIGLVAGLLLLWLVLVTAFTVDEGERAVVKRWSKVNRTVEPGLNFKIPIMEDTVTFDVRRIKQEFEFMSASLDSLRIKTFVAVEFSVNKSEVGEFYAKYKDYDRFSNIFLPVIAQLVKESVSQYESDDVIPRREEIAEVFFEKLKEVESDYYITIHRATIPNAVLPKNYSDAIENKKSQEENAKAEEHKLKAHEHQSQQEVNTANADAEAIELRAEAEAKAIEIKATAQAEANKLISATLTDDLITIRQIEAWNGVMPKVLTGEKGGMGMILPSDTVNQN